MADRNSIIEKIRALLAKTIENGAAEAAEAARAVTISTVWPGDRPRCGNDKHKPRPDRR
jgi:hypothetical protein